jgi:hypothetical protein
MNKEPMEMHVSSKPPPWKKKHITKKQRPTLSQPPIVPVTPVPLFPIPWGIAFSPSPELHCNNSKQSQNANPDIISTTPLPLNIRTDETSFI